MRQFSKQNQLAKTGSGHFASQRSVTPANKQLPNRSFADPAVLPFGFHFSRIAVHGKTPVGIQPKLTVGALGDAFEQEADRVGERVMRMSDPRARTDASAGLSQYLVAPAAKLQTKFHTGGSGGIAAPPIVHNVLRSSGRPLDAATRSFMEPRFGHDFGKVRVHADAKAEEAASSIDARAFTSGRSIVFGAGEYAPQTDSGRRLLSHELTHVVQQGGRAPTVQRQIAKEKPKKGGKPAPERYR